MAAAALEVRRAGAAVFSGAWKSGTGTEGVREASPASPAAAVPSPAGSAVAAAFLVVRLRVVVFFAAGLSVSPSGVAPLSAVSPGSAVAAVFLVVRLRAVVFFAGAGVSPLSAVDAAASGAGASPAGAATFLVVRLRGADFFFGGGVSSPAGVVSGVVEPSC